MDLSSYPPPYRQPIHQNKTRDPSQPLHQPTADSDLLLPQIDFHHLDPKELAEACRDWGMFRLVNHGVPTDLSNRLRDQIKQLFSLPFESKEANWKGPIAYFWDNPAALTPNGMVMKRSLPNLNWVEGFSVRLSQLPQLQGDDDHDPMLKSFGCLLEEYGRHMARLAHTLFDVLITNLGMDQALCAPYLSESTGYLRLYRYPPYPDPDQVSGLEAHTDSSVLSILNENVVGGLQVFKDERWIDIKPVSDTLVVNMGDMMQAVSNDEYKSVLHRVLALKREERFSICYFVYPPRDLMIQSTKYRPFTYNMYMHQVREDRETIGGKVGLPRFMLSEPLN